MNERRWWNGSWSRLTRRDVYVRNAADGRWQVELRRGGPDGRVRTRAFGSEHDAVEWIESSVIVGGADWREVPRRIDSRQRRNVARKLRRVS
ncbi:hypothetical protein [Dactylosporangium sp. CA-139066]|uniref:hypothetical protein n=1 Tax=Dactylosporangium sp. CA-139066 TaxID=3239930 RepID=UPI003D90E3D9